MSNRSRGHQDGPLVTTRSMISPRLAEPGLRVLTSLCASTFVLLAAPSAFAQGKLDARYEATLAGLPVGQGALTLRSCGNVTPAITLGPGPLADGKSALGRADTAFRLSRGEGPWAPEQQSW